MKRTHASLAGIVAAALLAAAPASANDVTLVGTAGRVALTEAVRSQMSAIVKREAESCSVSSVGYPDVFRGREGAAEWRAAEKRPRLHVRYATPIVMRLGIRRGPPVLASEVLIGIDDPKFIRQPLTRHQGVVTLHGKCSGGAALELMCLPALRPYFAETVANSCGLLERKPG